MQKPRTKEQQTDGEDMAVPPTLTFDLRRPFARAVAAVMATLFDGRTRFDDRTTWMDD